MVIGISEHEIVSMFGLRNARRSGRNIVASCPFSENHPHGDRHPSFSINADTGLWICFSCGERGNIVQLAERVLGMSSFEAREMFEFELTTEAIDSLMSASAAPKPMTTEQVDVSNWSVNRCEYWAYRGFSDETVRKWMLGYDPESRRAVVPVMWKREIIGWSKRAVDDGVQPKWVHSPGLPKSDILFGMDNFSGDSAVLVEAPLSVIMLDQQGIGNAVASFGCSLSEKQSRLLRSHYNNVLIFYDPDGAGINGTRKALAMLEPFVDVFVVPPTRDDPAAMTADENMAALRGAIPSWAMDI